MIEPTLPLDLLAELLWPRRAISSPKIFFADTAIRDSFLIEKKVSTQKTLQRENADQFNEVRQKCWCVCIIKTVILMSDRYGANSARESMACAAKSEGTNLNRDVCCGTKTAASDVKWS